MKITLKFIQIQFQSWKTLQKHANQVANFRFKSQGTFGIVLKIRTGLCLAKLQRIKFPFSYQNVSLLLSKSPFLGFSPYVFCLFFQHSNLYKQRVPLKIQQTFSRFMTQGRSYLALGPPKIVKFSLRVYKKKTQAPPRIKSSPPKLFSTTSPIQLQIKQKYLSTFNLVGQSKILNHTKFFSFKLKKLPAQPNPKSEIPNPNQTKITSHFCLNSQSSCSHAFALCLMALVHAA